MAFNIRDQDTFTFVTCKECGQRHDTESVEFLNIEEDQYGYDLMTFTCPVTGKATKSIVFRG